MKIRVTLSVKTSCQAGTTVDVVVGPSDTVASVKEKVSSVQLVPFPEQELTFEGTVLSDESKLRACGVADGSSLSLEVKATEATLTQQLSELLEARDLSSDELSLLYCYKHGASVGQALKVLGFEGKLPDFIAKQKGMSLENGTVTLVRTDTALKPFSVVDEVVQILKAHYSDVMFIKDLCAKFVEKFGVSLSSIVGCRPVEFLSKEKASFTVHGSGKVSLQGVRKKVSPRSTGSGSGSDSGPSAAITAPPGLGGDAPPGLGGESSSALPVDELQDVDCQQFTDLHNTIHSRQFNSKIVQSLNDIVGSLSDTIFLDIDHVVTSGSIGKGTAITGDATAKVVLFIRDLPPTGPELWYPSLLKAVAGFISQDFQDEHGIEHVNVMEDCIKLHTRGAIPLDVDLLFSPTYENYQHAVQVLRDQGPDARRVHAPAFVKERTQFVSRQPTSVKVTIRLMKWWRDQQEWYGRVSRPSDEILELTAIYSAVQTKPENQKQAIANLMSLLSRFDQMRVVWSNYYSKDDVWAPLLRQRPLLMDPANPFINVAEPHVFDSSELMVLAKSTHFFW